MSLPKHNSNHSSKSSLNTDAETNRASSFEETQHENLQKIIESLAQQILSSQQDEENADPKSQLALLRVYAQYMNLYMKFKNKYIPQNPEEKQKQESKPTNGSNHKSNTNNKKKSLLPSLSTNGTIEFIRQSNHQHQQKQIQQNNPQSALVMKPSPA